MKVVYYSSYGGIDWHDACSRTEFLKEKHHNPYNISNPVKAIAEKLYDIFDGFVEDCLTNNPNEHYHLSFDLSVEDIVEKINNKEEISLYDCVPNPRFSGDDYDNWIIFNPEALELNINYFGGQCSYNDYFVIADIPDENVRYIVCENFLAPNKGVPSIQRFYNEPFNDYNEMLHYYCTMSLHSDYDYGKSVKEIIIVDSESLKEDDWFNSNMRAIELSKDHPEADFKMYVQDDIKYLQGLK